MKFKVGDKVVAKYDLGSTSHIYKGKEYIINTVIEPDKYISKPRVMLNCPIATGTWNFEHFKHIKIKATKLAKKMYPNRREEDGWLL